jgi:hypothetical protein
MNVEGTNVDNQPKHTVSIYREGKLAAEQYFEDQDSAFSVAACLAEMRVDWPILYEDWEVLLDGKQFIIE